MLVEWGGLFDHYEYPLFIIQYEAYQNVILWSLMIHNLIH